jgi:hypothetical protein
MPAFQRKDKLVSEITAPFRGLALTGRSGGSGWKGSVSRWPLALFHFLSNWSLKYWKNSGLAVK